METMDYIKKDGNFSSPNLFSDNQKMDSCDTCGWRENWDDEDVAVQRDVFTGSFPEGKNNLYILKN